MAQMPQIWVKTSFFQDEAGEGQLTNPGRYGQAFSHWLAEQFQARGEHIQDVLPEDWGWCVMFTHQPHMLWVGCGNRAGNIDEWGAFVVVEPSLFQRLFSRRDIKPTVERIHKTLYEIMRQVPGAKKVWVEE